MPSLLMCPPDYFAIEYEINPWMSKRRPADRDIARQQWWNLHDLLTKKLGIKVELLSPVTGLPDLVFTANAGLIIGRGFIASRFRHPERQREQPVYEAWFRRQGYTLLGIPEGSFFEGEGDVLRMGQTWFAGYQIRSDVQAHLKIGELLQQEVLSLELVDPRFYHLDTCFCPLDDRRAVYYPPAFDGYGRKVIHQFVREPIAVSEADALRLGCNALVTGREVILQEGCEELNRVLRAAGFKVHPLDLSEFHKAGGSAKCLVLWLSD
jgi:N-dimethylarginine dimethylaminohydrolase